jgi:ribose 1,5-bisphosphate isomerase
MKDIKKFNKILSDIKSIKIQGAGNIAKNALYAYSLIPTKRSKKKLLSLRPTEPMLKKVLSLIDKHPYQEILNHFDFAQEKINLHFLKLLSPTKNKKVFFTHCHSTNVVNALIHAKNKKKKFEVYNTETRPLFQGRKTAEELKNAGIKITMFIDSAAMIALTKRQKTKKVDKIFFGADALTPEGIVNKVGSGMFARIAHDNKIPVYIIADSWKFTKDIVEMEKRGFREVWKKFFKKIEIKNPSFEFVPKKYITGIITEFGLMKYDVFVKEMLKS